MILVVLVTGILAAIAIPASIAQREQAFSATVRSDLHIAAIAAESFAARTGTYSGLDLPALKANGYKPTEGVSVAVTSETTSYSISASHSGSTPSHTWILSSGTGIITD